MRPKYKKYTVSAIFLALVLFFVIAALLIFPVPDQLTYLQKKVIENGRCTVSSGKNNFVIQADKATIENDMLILERLAAAGDDSFVVVNSRSNPILAKRVSIRYLTSPKDMLELTFYEVKSSTVAFGSMTFRKDCISKWRLWLSGIYKKFKNAISEN